MFDQQAFPYYISHHFFFFSFFFRKDYQYNYSFNRSFTTFVIYWFFLLHPTILTSFLQISLLPSIIPPSFNLISFLQYSLLPSSFSPSFFPSPFSTPPSLLSHCFYEWQGKYVTHHLATSEEGNYYSLIYLVNAINLLQIYI